MNLIEVLIILVVMLIVMTIALYVAIVKERKNHYRPIAKQTNLNLTTKEKR